MVKARGDSNAEMFVLSAAIRNIDGIVAQKICCSHGRRNAILLLALANFELITVL
jgi:hypothetical protein